MNVVICTLAALLLISACTVTDESQQTVVGDGQPEHPRGLRFATPATDPMAQYDDVKAELEDTGLVGLGFLGKSKDEAFYALVANCGGPIEIRDALIKGAVTNEQLVKDAADENWYMQKDGAWVPLRVELYQGWKYNIQWNVYDRPRSGGIWETVAGGYITDSCQVYAE